MYEAARQSRDVLGTSHAVQPRYSEKNYGTETYHEVPPSRSKGLCISPVPTREVSRTVPPWPGSVKKSEASKKWYRRHPKNSEHKTIVSYQRLERILGAFEPHRNAPTNLRRSTSRKHSTYRRRCTRRRRRCGETWGQTLLRRQNNKYMTKPREKERQAQLQHGDDNVNRFIAKYS